MIEEIVYQEKIAPVVETAERAARAPDWDFISRTITEEVDSIYARRVIPKGKIKWYEFSKEWEKYSTAIIENVMECNLLAIVANKHTGEMLNSFAYEIFLHSNDSLKLVTANSWITATLSSMTGSSPSRRAAYEDTQAELLYKMGRKDEAITIETIALELADVAFLRKEIKEVLDKMESGKPTGIPKAGHDTLPAKFDSLKAAIVTATFRPRAKGDTLEYNTEHVQMRPNAEVEELLRRLPGLHVDPDGAITYNGEKIQRLLVDGEDILGDDLTLVTRTFDAGKIARVQILNRKSDRARFTGMDDGSRVKTLNLVMKESAKNGYFGKAEVGGSAHGYYNAAAALAGLRDKEQVTVLGMSSNTGQLGFSSNGGTSPGIRFLRTLPDPLGASAGAGIPRFTAAALHYANRWNSSEDHLVVNYQYGHLWTNPISSTQLAENQPGTIYYQNQQSQSINQQDQHLIRITYDWALSSKSAIEINVSNGFFQYQNRYKAASISQFNDTLANSGARSIQDNSGKHSVNGQLDWRIQLGRKSGRMLSINSGLQSSNFATNGYLYSLSHYFQQGGIPQSVDTVDQRKRILGQNDVVTGGVTYTQPLFSGVTLGINYGLSVSYDNPVQSTYNRGSGKYDRLVDSLSISWIELLIRLLVNDLIPGRLKL
ncbi:hypothetical protein GP486_007936 [Trichoglossum hirsutum]|uniref:Uncharacterized protein n=1 Tax=Trichoglossum hirsutum TaxID=265104 RepID=A0A9P8IJ47_9PEZI|nr:hypothetical protein GP486_007936 [Trichoglossum hirsutum]